VFQDLSKPYVQIELVIGSDPVKIYQIQKEKFKFELPEGKF